LAAQNLSHSEQNTKELYFPTENGNVHRNVTITQEQGISEVHGRHLLKGKEKLVDGPRSSAEHAAGDVRKKVLALKGLQIPCAGKKAARHPRHSAGQTEDGSFH